MNSHDSLDHLPDAATPESGAWLRLAAEQLPAVMWTTDTELRFTSGQGAGLSHLNLHPNQLNGTLLYDYFQTRDPAFPALNAHLRALKGESVSYEQVWDDRVFESRTEPLRDKTGEIIGVVGLALDVTENRLANEIHRESEERFCKAFNSSPIAMLISRIDDGQIIDMNDTFQRMSGYRREEVLGRTAADLNMWTEPSQRDQLLASVREHGSVRGFEASFVTRDGEIRAGRLSAEMIELRGQPCLLAIAEDITDQKRAAQKLSQAYGEMEVRVQERTAELSVANEKLTEQIEVRARAEGTIRAEQQLLRQLLDINERERKIIAHEIHDGLMQYVIAARMLLDTFVDQVVEAGREPDELLTQSHGLMVKAVAEGRRLISESYPLIIDEMGVVAAIGYLVAEEHSREGLEIKFIHDVRFERLSPLLEGTMFRIVQEALNNVKRHSQAKSASVWLSQEDDNIHLEIRDQGIGFNPHEIPAGHFGVQGIVERARLFGGSAEIKSEPGKGTRILVQLPGALPTDVENLRAGCQEFRYEC